MHRRAVKDDLAPRALLHPGDLAHEGRFARAIVTHDGHMLPLAEHEIRILQRMNTAIMLGETLGL